MSILAARLAPSYLAAGVTYTVDLLLVVIKLRLKIKVQLLFAYNQAFFSAVTQFPNIPRLALCHGMPFPPAKWHAGMPPHDFLMPPSLLVAFLLGQKADEFTEELLIAEHQS